MALIAGDVDGSAEDVGARTREDAQTGTRWQSASGAVGAGGTEYERALAERDARIAELKARGESERIGFEIQMAGCRSMKAARALLDDRGGDVAALKEAEPWLFEGSAPKQTGKTWAPQRWHSVRRGQDDEEVA